MKQYEKPRKTFNSVIHTNVAKIVLFDKHVSESQMNKTGIHVTIKYWCKTHLC